MDRTIAPEKAASARFDPAPPRYFFCPSQDSGKLRVRTWAPDMATTDPAERLLYAELAAGVARALPWSLDTFIWRPGRGSAGEVISHDRMLAFEIASELLERLTLIDAINAEGELVPPAETTIRRLRIDVAAIPAYIAKTAPTDPPPEDLLAAFTGLCAQRGIMPTDRDAIFTPPHAYLPLMKALSAAGYAEAAGDMFSWTDKSAPAMRAQHLWSAA